MDKPAAALGVPERLNLIVRALTAARLQRGEARVEGLFMSIGALADVVRDEHGRLVQLADGFNLAADAINALLRSNDALREELAQLRRRAALRAPGGAHTRAPARARSGDDGHDTVRCAVAGDGTDDADQPAGGAAGGPSGRGVDLS